MDSFNSGVNIGSVLVHTTDNRPRTAEEISDLAIRKIIYVGDSLPSPIKEQALVYQESIKKIITFYINEALNEHKSTYINKLLNTNQADAADLLRSL